MERQVLNEWEPTPQSMQKLCMVQNHHGGVRRNAGLAHLMASLCAYHLRNVKSVVMMLRRNLRRIKVSTFY